MGCGAGGPGHMSMVGHVFFFVKCGWIIQGRVHSNCPGTACFRYFWGDTVPSPMPNTSHRGSLIVICGRDHKIGCALRPRTAQQGKGAALANSQPVHEGAS